MHMSRNVNVARHIPKFFLNKSNSLRSKSTIAIQLPKENTYTVDQSHYFKPNTTSLPIYLDGNTMKTTQNTVVENLSTEGLIYCVSSFFALKSIKDDSILAVQAFHISDKDKTNIIDLSKLEEPLKRKNIEYKKECLTYYSIPAVESLLDVQSNTLQAISELCKTHQYERTITFCDNPDSISLNLKSSELHPYMSKDGENSEKIKKMAISVFSLSLLICYILG